MSDCTQSSSELDHERRQQPPLNAYELQRELRIGSNKARMEAMGLRPL